MARKSFDIGRAPKKSAKEPEKTAPKKRRPRHPQLSQRSSRRPLRDRRREATTRALVLAAFGVLLAAGALVYLLWRPEARIKSVSAPAAPDAASVEALAEKELQGTYYGIVPKDSFFFYPERAMRAAILERYPGIAAVSIGRSGLTSLHVEVSPRVAAFRWCGAPSSLSAGDVTCYDTDAEGFVFAPSEFGEGEEELLPVYAELDLAEAGERAPLRGRVMGTSDLPDILRFVRAIEGLGVPVASVAIRGDEADLFVAPSSRITYVIGKEEEARANAEAAFGTLNLQDGSLEYVDLRFAGKVYLKRRE